MLTLFLSLLGVSALAVLVLILFIWIVGLLTHDASVIDLVWGLSFAVIAGVCIYTLSKTQAITPYMWVLTALPVVWATRYSLYIWRRNIGHGEDKRYTAMREGIPKNMWPIYCLLRVYGFQAVAMLVVALPIIVGLASGAAYATSISALSIIGVVIWFIGFSFEAIGDFQLARFIQRRKRLGAEVTGTVMNKGLWKYTRHPNYFGNATLWWGIFLVACDTPWGFLSFLGPLFMNFALLKISGAAHLERTLSKRPAYAAYMKTTSGFIPRRPKPAA